MTWYQQRYEKKFNPANNLSACPPSPPTQLQVNAKERSLLMITESLSKLAKRKNASNNDTMIEELANLLDNFPGAANQTCCFLHILNLVVKSIIKQFDLPKAKANGILDEAAKELLALAGDIALEEEQTRDVGKDDKDDDNEEGWIDECELMSELERDELDESVQPVRLLLIKVSRFITSHVGLGFNMMHSCGRPRLLSRTRLQSYCHDGMKSFKNSNTTTALCRETSPLDGTRPTTCSFLRLRTAKHLIQSQVNAI